MPTSTPTPMPRWWQRRGPSLLVLSAVMVVLVLVTAVLARDVTEVLPEVAKDQLGEDRWEDPLGIERSGDFQVVHVPDCAEGPLTRIVLWDSDSKPYWEVAAAIPTPLKAFIVGVTSAGFTEVVPYEEPPVGTVLRLVAFRRVGGPVGLRYRTSQLSTRPGRVVSGSPLKTYTVEGFLGEPVCGDSPSDDGVATTTTLVAELRPLDGTTTTTTTGPTSSTEPAPDQGTDPDGN